MTDEELRLEALRIALADLGSDDLSLIERAKQIEAYVRGEGATDAR